MTAYNIQEYDGLESTLAVTRGKKGLVVSPDVFGAQSSHRKF